ncbi:glycosyltransferase [Patescibacteria group bacterium]|nr:glycosyltransferase [Patescibacteria group bacterium]
MKLLMITRKVDKGEHLAGFIYNWVKKIGEQVEELRVISWQEGDSSGLPENIKINHLKTNQNKLVKIFKFKMLVKKNIKQVDGVFCHQMPIYTILAAPIAKLYKKKVVSWYMHRQIDSKMKLMEKLADVVLSASKESFRLASKKLVITGHGIDVELFKPGTKQVDGKFKILSVGRISPTKDYESMIKAVDILVDSGVKNIKLTIIGDAGLAIQKGYFENLKLMVQNMKLQEQVEFLGPIPQIQIPKYLQNSDLFINMSGTGSVDKTVLEAMACECLVLTSNEAFKDIVGSNFMVGKDNPKDLAEKIKQLMNLSKEEKQQIRSKLRNEVVQNHNLDNLVKRITEQFK